MRVSIVAAMSKDRIIGSSTNKNRFGLLWDVPEDRKLFKKLTEGKTVVMGRKTFDAMGNKALVNRCNIILTRSKNISYQDCEVAASFKEVVDLCKTKNEIMICGGAEIYKSFINLAQRMYISTIDGVWDGDVLFPQINWDNWLLSQETKMQKFTFRVWDKKE